MDLSQLSTEDLQAIAAKDMSKVSEAGLRLLAGLERGGELASFHLLPAARADLLRRLGRKGEAAAAYREAIARVGNAAERRFLERRLAECGGAP